MRCADRIRGKGPAKGPAVVAVFLALGLSLAACRTTNAPRAYRIAPEALASRVAGSWVEVQRRDRTFVSGELLAAVGDTLFTVAGHTLTLTPAGTIRRVTLTRYRPDINDLVVWALLGTASTASHGFGLIVSAPLWIATGIATTAAENRRAILVTSNFEVLAPWSRFPAGIPSSIDRTRLREAIPVAGPP